MKRIKWLAAAVVAISTLAVGIRVAGANKTVTIDPVDPPAQVALAQTQPATTTPDPWADSPLLERACSCESWGDPNKVPREFNSDGSILWGQETDPATGKTIVVKRDVGACQINTQAWGKTAAALGLDLEHSLADNIAFAKKLNAQYGMQPWAASKSCWKE